MTKYYRIYYTEPWDPTFSPKALKTVNSEEIANYEIKIEKLKFKELEYFFEAISLEN